MDLERDVAGGGVGRDADVDLEEARDCSGGGAGVRHIGRFAIDQDRYRPSRRGRVGARDLAVDSAGIRLAFTGGVDRNDAAAGSG